MTIALNTIAMPKRSEAASGTVLGAMFYGQTSVAATRSSARRAVLFLEGPRRPYRVVGSIYAGLQMQAETLAHSDTFRVMALLARYAIAMVSWLVRPQPGKAAVAH